MNDDRPLSAEDREALFRWFEDMSSLTASLTRNWRKTFCSIRLNPLHAWLVGRSPTTRGLDDLAGLDADDLDGTNGWDLDTGRL